MIEKTRIRPDGSIDTAHYMQRGRQARSTAAANLARRAWPRKGLIALVASLFGVALLMNGILPV